MRPPAQPSEPANNDRRSGCRAQERAARIQAQPSAENNKEENEQAAHKRVVFQLFSQDGAPS